MGKRREIRIVSTEWLMRNVSNGVKNEGHTEGRNAQTRNYKEYTRVFVKIFVYVNK